MSHEIEIEDMPGLEEINIAENVRKMLVGLGEDPDREGLVRTPLRFEKAMQYPYRTSPVWDRNRYSRGTSHCQA